MKLIRYSAVDSSIQGVVESVQRLLASAVNYNWVNVNKRTAVRGARRISFSHRPSGPSDPRIGELDMR